MESNSLIASFGACADGEASLHLSPPWDFETAETLISAHLIVNVTCQ